MSKFALLIGPSGSGKTTVANLLHEKYGLTQIESYTTRAPRYDGERGHTFVTDQEFDKLTDYVAYTEFDGHRYCATSEQVEANDIYVVDVVGAEYFAELYHGNKKPIVFYLTADTQTLQSRMLNRGDGALTVAQRVENDLHMFENAEYRLEKLYDDVIILNNVDLELATAAIMDAMEEGDIK